MADKGHTLPETWEDIQPCVQALMAILTGKQEADWLEIAVHATEILQFALHLLGADTDHLIGKDSVSNATDEQMAALAACLKVCNISDGKMPAGGIMVAWSVQTILQELVLQLLELIEQLTLAPTVPLAVGKLGDGTILRILLENLPAIIALIFSLFEKEK